MQHGRSFAVSLMGLAGNIIEVEADLSSNLPNFLLVGLPDASLSEATARVRAAITNSGLSFPNRRITVNLSPASVPKQGSAFDLSIAMSILAADRAVNSKSVASRVHLGELALDGTVRPVRGILPSILAAKRAGYSSFVVPAGNLAEASLVADVEVVAVATLLELALLHGHKPNSEVAIRLAAELSLTPRSSSLPVAAEPAAPAIEHSVDISEVVGQADAVEALLIAAVGGHHLSMVGPPGAGKTMLAERLPTLLPDLDQDSALDCIGILSLVGKVPDFTVDGVSLRPRIEAPHHSASVAAMVGGGTKLIQPGAISLAHRGVLFLDEAPEFHTNVLESLRQPLESGTVSVHRATGVATFPARFQLVLASNPCPCGFLGQPKKECLCTPWSIRKYQAKLSGPLLDRIDIQLRLEPANPNQVALGSKQKTPTSAELREKVVTARKMTEERLKDTPWMLNSEVPGPQLRRRFHPGKSATRLLDAALDRQFMSMRGYDRCLRLAWSIAELDGRTKVTEADIHYANSLRTQESA